MKGQYSIEVIMVVAAFLMVVSIFAGIYIDFMGEEKNLGTRAALSLEASRLGNAINHVYVMGPGNRIEVDIGLGEYVLVGHGNLLRLEAGGASAEKEVFAEVEEVEIRNAEVVVVENNGEIMLIGEGPGSVVGDE